MNRLMSGLLSAKTVSSHAAVIGLVGAPHFDCDASIPWRSSIERTQFRCAGELICAHDSTCSVAYRGSPGGFFRNQKYTILLDGHIDNLEEVARELDERSHSVAGSPAELLALFFEELGTTFLSRIVGNYAIAFVGHATGETLLARDRYGIKPLFYARIGSRWVWASELKLIQPFLDNPRMIPDGLRQAIHYRFMVGETLIDGVRQVMPSSYVSLAEGKESAETSYWTMTFQPSTHALDLDLWADEADNALTLSLEDLGRTHRDVGVLLSGGVDSSLLAMKAARAGFRNCIAFTARWPGENPELEWACSVARHLGIEHRVIDIDEAFVERTFPWLVWQMEEAPRHYNSFTLAALFEAASPSCSVLLNGHTADVMFGPQSCVAINVFMTRQAQLEVIPRQLRRAIADVLPDHTATRAGRLRSYLAADVHEFMQTQFRIHYGRLGDAVFGRFSRSHGPSLAALNRFYDPSLKPTERFQIFDLYTFNQSYMAVFDRLGAPCNVEVCMPFLSQHMVDVALKLPSGLKFENQSAKPVLKRLAARFFPRNWIYSNKQGFPTQSSRWLQGPLSHWTKDLLGGNSEINEFLDVRPLEFARAGSNDEAAWPAMSLEMFRRQFLSENFHSFASPWV